MSSTESLIQVALAGVMGMIGLFALGRVVYFQFVAARAVGTVIGATPGRGQDTRQDLVEFQTPEGRVVRFVNTGPSWSGRKVVRGKTVDVRYSPSNPEARPIVWSPKTQWLRPVLYMGLAAIVIFYRAAR